MTDARFRAIFSAMTADEREVILAALAAMVIDCHAPQDCLDGGQWCLAERMFRWLNRPRVPIAGEAPTTAPIDGGQR